MNLVRQAGIFFVNESSQLTEENSWKTRVSVIVLNLVRKWVFFSYRLLETTCCFHKLDPLRQRTLILTHIMIRTPVFYQNVLSMQPYAMHA